MTRFGREGIKKYKLPPFVDGSCRREPDFESEFPSITAICRAGKFAPRLIEGDYIVYLTVKHKYLKDIVASNKFISVLKVLYRFNSHQEAGEWYLKNGLKLPGNCLVNNNPPLRVEYTIGSMKEMGIRRIEKYIDLKLIEALKKYIIEWDKDYWEKVSIYPFKSNFPT